MFNDNNRISTILYSRNADTLSQRSREVKQKLKEKYFQSTAYQETKKPPLYLNTRKASIKQQTNKTFLTDRNNLGPRAKQGSMLEMTNDAYFSITDMIARQNNTNVCLSEEENNSLYNPQIRRSAVDTSNHCIIVNQNMHPPIVSSVEPSAKKP